MLKLNVILQHNKKNIPDRIAKEKCWKYMGTQAWKEKIWHRENICEKQSYTAFFTMNMKKKMELENNYNLQ